MKSTTAHPLDAVSVDEIPAETVLRWHAAIADELRAAFETVLPAPRFTLGPRLREFEAELAAYVGTTHCIGVSSGTAALTLALRALGVGPGDEVITVCNTYVATAFAITYTGATPVFVDVDPVTLNMDPAQIPAALSEKTKSARPIVCDCVPMVGETTATPSSLACSTLSSLPYRESARSSVGAKSRFLASSMAGSSALTSLSWAASTLTCVIRFGWLLSGEYVSITCIW